MSTIESVSLYFKEGSSDKEYHVQIEESGSGYMVLFQYGRRGSALKQGTKTASPVSLKEAGKIYTKLVDEKKGKGYQESVTSKSAPAPIATSSKPVNEKSSVAVQLLNPIDTTEVAAKIKDPNFIAQEKKDGERRAVEKSEGIAKGINRKGLYVTLPKEISDSIFEDGIYDGEIIGDKLFVFDLLELDGSDLRNKPFLDRYEQLKQVDFGSNVEVVSVAITESEKKQLLEKVQSEGGEGIVFKNKNAKYTSGRPNSGGDQLKYKLYKTATFIVGSITKAKRSVGLVVLDGVNEVDVGKVTIPPNHEVPVVGSVVEVRYLYANRGGAVYQPVYLGLRNDLDENEAVIEQLEYKNEAA